MNDGGTEVDYLSACLAADCQGKPGQGPESVSCDARGSLILHWLISEHFFVWFV